MHSKIKQKARQLLQEEERLYRLSLCASPRTQKKIIVSINSKLSPLLFVIKKGLKRDMYLDLNNKPLINLFLKIQKNNLIFIIY